MKLGNNEWRSFFVEDVEDVEDDEELDDIDVVLLATVLLPLQKAYQS